MRFCAAMLLTVLMAVGPVAAQQPPGLRVERSSGALTNVQVAFDRGYAAVDLSLVEDLGWSVDEAANEVRVSVAAEVDISLRVGSPFFRWDGIVLQLTHAPYRDGGRTLIPLQLLTDFFPRRLPDLYEFDGPTLTLRAGDPDLIGGGAGGPPAVEEVVRDPASSPVGATPVTELAAPEQIPSGPSPFDGERVVIIDAGHGGADPGALGPRGVREKDVALGIAVAMAEILRRESDLVVYMTRDDDTFVDLWERGEIATDVKGDRPGLFVSIHANSFPDRRSTQGFETYFLSEARTAHERRVSAIENAPLSFQGQDVDPDLEPDLSFILRELRNLDHQHWSALLAEMVQEELDDFHPGPNRGVKQGILAVLTNALMPSILVEAGYLSNEDEGLLLGESSFQRDAAEAVARAVVRFFERYPPGSGAEGPREDS